MGIVESETASFAQLKGAKTVTGGIRGSVRRRPTR
jgi:hypothetical protein